MDKNVQDTRRNNLAALVSMDGLSSVAKRVGKADSQLSDMIAKRKSFGEKVARAIESSYDPSRQSGWLDIDLDPQELPKPKALTGELLREDEAIFSLLDVRASCGHGAVNSDYPEIIKTMVMSSAQAIRLVGTQNKSGNVQVIVAANDSMYPTIKPDDLLFVDTSVNDFSGESIYILLHGGELVCKRLSLVGKTLTVISDNQSYPQWPWDDKPDETKIIGRVIRALPMDFKKFGSAN